MTVKLDQIIAFNKIYIEKGLITARDDAAMENGAFFEKVYRLLKAVHAEAVLQCFQDAGGKEVAVIYNAERCSPEKIAAKIALRH
ncbi:MAG: hypothetical protein Q4G07_05005 [Oscillospiraceae bacterium]|nr:hypothetical protein [Oscillospiraceae bacterium]